MMKRRPREPWELWARPAVALVFIAVYRLAACGQEEPPPPVPSQPPAWVVEDARP